MKSDTIQFGNFSVPLQEFASQGNAILGIRDSGKSYTATLLAERLLDYGIPFVAFDPIGVWRSREPAKVTKVPVLDPYSSHNWYYGPCPNGQKSPCYSVLFLQFFQKALPRTKPRKPRRGEGRGTRGCPVPSTFRLYFAGKPPRALPFPS